MYDLFIAPFADYLFMKRALIACLGISLSSAPVGVILVLRRMSLVADALSHAILPGIAIGFLIAGLWLPALTIGGIIAGIIVCIASGWISRRTILPEDASFTGFYIISLALGVLILSVKGGSMNLLHFLFGGVLAVNEMGILLIAFTTTLTILTLALVYRPLIYECFDPTFVHMMGVRGSFYHYIFLSLVVINLVAAYQALGTLMALGIMMLPAIAARLLARQVWSIFLCAMIIGMLSSYFGLLLSYHLDWPSGPTIILVCGCFYFLALSKKKI